MVSAKDGTNIEAVLQAIVERFNLKQDEEEAFMIALAQSLSEPLRRRLVHAQGPVGGQVGLNVGFIAELVQPALSACDSPFTG